MNYDLEDRSAKFGESVLNFVKELPSDRVVDPLVRQIVRSATSIGANYMEANQGSSKKDFRNKINICRKESNETKHWLRMLSTACPTHKSHCRVLWQEAHELTLIFATISKNSLEN